MSIIAVAWALKQPVKRSSVKFVLVAMANYADENGRCYPSQARLSSDTSQDRKTVMGALASLCELGLIKDTGERVGPTRSVVVYRIAVPSFVEVSRKRDSLNEEAVPFFPASCPVFPGEAVPKTVHRTVKEESVIEPLKNIGDWPDDYVDQFWSKYPPGRKTGKAAVARKLATIRKSKLPFATLMRGLDRYVASNPDPQYTKGPLVWLNQGCWDDEYKLARGVRQSSSRNGFAKMLFETMQEDGGGDSDGFTGTTIDG